MRALIALTVGAALVAGCASGPRKPSARALQQIDRALAKAPGKAQPSVIVKTELALARAKRELGPKQALQFFAAPGAKLHRREGLVDAVAHFEEQSSGSGGPKLETKTVLMSCDGQLAVSQGRLTENGKVGNYIMVWERQRDISTRGGEETGYRYVYFTAAPDDPQPAPRPPLPTPQPGDIVVEALASIRADIGRCAPRDEIVLEAPSQPAEGVTQSTSQSRDRTLQWGWSQTATGDTRIWVSLWRRDGRETVFTQDLRLDR